MPKLSLPELNTTRSLYSTRRNRKLVFVVIGLFLELFHFFLLVQIDIRGIAEACGDGPIRFVGDTENIHASVLFPLTFLELERCGRNFEGQIDLSDVSGAV